MNSKKIFFSFLIILLVSSCSKSPGKTVAKLKLNLSGIVNLSSGIGSGGAILYGKNSQGDSFGKKINSSEDSIVIPNGAWTFYAVMWGSESTAMNGKVYCGKNSSQLTGAETTVSMSLNNANCTDAEFSNGKTYYDAGTSANRFADLFIEECDEVNATTGFGCGLDNQGSALSYRLKFQSFNRSASGNIVLGPDILTSSCKKVDLTGSPSLDIYRSGFDVNFPSGNGVAPITVTMELFVGTQNCDTSDPKGVYQVVLNQGLGAPAVNNDKVLVSNFNCSFFVTPDFSTGTELQKTNKCEAAMGSWNGSSCNGVSTAPAMIMRFLPAGECTNSVASNFAIKHQVSIPKTFLCDRYLDNSNILGAHQFAGGNGSKERPYKICTEWQLNQIGEANAANTIFSSQSFKLMNDLDMNKTDFNPALRPSCVGVANSIYKEHSNMNPLDQLTIGGCEAANINASPNFYGSFNGNNKTISHARLEYETVNGLGFVRNLNSSGKIKNLNFYDLSVRGNGTVGGIAGTSGATIKNVNIERGNIEGQASFVGGAVGNAVSGGLSNLHVNHVNVHGTTNVGGIAGNLNASLDSSMYRGELRAQANAVGAVGGIAGATSGGSSITKTFSEGSINSYVSNSGGIVGSNTGMITDSYSNMYILSYFGTTAATVGGIVGANTNSSIDRVYSDSILDYRGGNGSSVIDGINAGSTAITNVTSCLSSTSTTNSGCTLKTYATLRDGTNFPAQANWKSNVSGALPRLTWEFDSFSRPCLLAPNLATIAAQSAAGRGTALNPLYICSASQLFDLNGNTQFSVLAEDLNISAMTTGNLLTSFSGNFDGNKNALYGLNISSSSSGHHGIIISNSGFIKDLNLVGNKMVHSNPSGATAVLVGNNSGLLRNINILGNTIDGVNYVGTIAGQNTATGTIEVVAIDQTNIRGATYVGGVTGENAGILRRISSNAGISELSGYPNFNIFGGVTASNTAGATVDQAMFSGNIQFSNVSASVASTNIFTGGIVGINSGLIKNSMAQNRALLKIKNYGKVGGLIGDNTASGNVQTSIALAGVNYIMGTIPASQDFHALIGSNSGTIDSNTFYLENHAGVLVETATASVCNGSNMSFSGSPSSLYAASTLVDLAAPAGNFSGSGNVLMTYSPFASPLTNFVIDYTASCTTGDMVNLFKAYEPNIIGKFTIANFANPSLFNGFNIAVDTGNPSTSTRLSDMFDYYRSDMYQTPIPANAPIWKLEVGDQYPSLLQVRN